MKYYLKDFKGSNDTQRIIEAMGVLKNNHNSTLVIEPGIYHISTPRGLETMNDLLLGKYGKNSEPVIFNHNYNYAKAISFKGHVGTTIEAYGAIFEVDGFMEVISIEDAKDITIKGITIRHKRKPYVKGILTNKTRMDNGSYEFIYKLSSETPTFENTPLLRYAFFRKGQDCPILATIENNHHINSLTYQIIVDKDSEILDGDELYITHTFHSRPAILIERATNVTLKDVTINNQPGMGIVGNRSENILLDSLKIVPIDGDRFSTNTDATHFTSIKGDLIYKNCIFDGNGDDFSNVHCYYQKVIKRVSDVEVYIQEKTPTGTHAQSLDYPDVGDTLELTELNTLKVIDIFKVKEVYPMHECWMTKLLLDKPLPKNTDNLILADVTRLPNLVIKGCKASNHFARGALVKCRNALIEDNTFTNLRGPAIELAAESFWFEGVSPANVTIRNNLIKNCGYEFGNAGILIKTDCENPTGQTIFNIKINNNSIDETKMDHGIMIRNVDGAMITNNTIICKKDPIIVEESKNISQDASQAGSLHY